MISKNDLLLSLIITNGEMNLAFGVAGAVFATVPLGFWGIISAMKLDGGARSLFPMKVFNWTLILCGK